MFDPHKGDCERDFVCRIVEISILVDTNQKLKNGINIDDAIDNGIDILRSDVESIFKEIASDYSPDVPNGTRPVSMRSLEPLNEIQKERNNHLSYVEVYSLRTGGKRVVGKNISIYISIVVSGRFTN